MKTISAIAAAALLVVASQAQTQAPPAAAPPSPTAGRAPTGPKNVKVLTGLSQEELLRTMHLMRSSLGVGCEYCHAEVNGSLDFASDAKEEKQTAREMLEMVKRINAESFDGRTVIGCYTCHQGSSHAPTLVPLPVKLQPPSTPRPAATPAAEPMMTAESLITAYVNASAPAKPANRTLRGTLVDARGSAPLEVVQSGDRTLVRVTRDGREMTTVVSGSGGWMRDARGTRDMTPGELQHFEEVNRGIRLPLLDPAAQGWRPPRRDRVRDIDAWRIDRRISDSESERYWFHAKTGVLLRMMTVQATPAGRVPQQVDFADYRDVAGVQVPFSIVNSMVDVRSSHEKKFDSVELGPADLKRFAKE